MFGAPDGVGAVGGGSNNGGSSNGSSIGGSGGGGAGGGGISGGNNLIAQGMLRAPPLASLLPQIKSIATKLLPTAANGGSSGGDSFSDNYGGSGVVSAEVKEISSGPYLEAFCIAIFDAPINN